MSQNPIAQQIQPDGPNSLACSAISTAACQPLLGQNAESLIDVKRLRSITANDPHQEKELVDLYISHAREILNRLPSLIANGETNEVARLAHKLAGSSASIGASGVIAQLRQLENRAQQGQLTDATQNMALINQAFEAVCKAFQDISRSSGQPVDATLKNSPSSPPAPVVNSTAAFLVRQSTPANDSSDSIVDLKRFCTITGNDSNNERELANLFISQANDTLNRLPALIANNQSAEVARLAHKLAGSSGSLGFHSIVQPLKKLEHQAQQNQFADSNQWLAQARQQFDAIQRWLEKRMSCTQNG